MNNLSSLFSFFRQGCEPVICLIVIKTVDILVFHKTLCAGTGSLPRKYAKYRSMTFLRRPPQFIVLSLRNSSSNLYSIPNTWLFSTSVLERLDVFGCFARYVDFWVLIMAGVNMELLYG